MGSVNLVIVVGNLGKDPEVKFMQNGTPVCNFSVATSEQWKDKEGQKQEKTEWHRIVVWGKQAEACGQYLKKGRPVCVEGKIQTRDSEKDGVTKYVTEIKADRVTFLGGKDKSESAAPGSDDVGF